MGNTRSKKTDKLDLLLAKQETLFGQKGKRGKSVGLVEMDCYQNIQNLNIRSKVNADFCKAWL